MKVHEIESSGWVSSNESGELTDVNLLRCVVSKYRNETRDYSHFSIIGSKYLGIRLTHKVCVSNGSAQYKSENTVHTLGCILFAVYLPQVCILILLFFSFAKELYTE